MRNIVESWFCHENEGTVRLPPRRVLEVIADAAVTLDVVMVAANHRMCSRDGDHDECDVHSNHHVAVFGVPTVQRDEGLGQRSLLG